MPSDRPNDLDLRPGSQESNRSRQMQFLGDLPSPRTGEVPPALSPLDAFAMQSRLLAKRFEEEKNGRRISRLPPLTIQNEFGRQRQPQGYYRSRSAERDGSDGPSPEDEHSTPQSAKEITPINRPMSQYPTISDEFSGPISQYGPKLSPLGEEERTPPTAQEPGDYFTIPRAASPEPIEAPVETRVEEATPNTPGTKNGPAQAIRARPQRTPTLESTTSARSDSRGLMPPRSPGPARSPRLVSPTIRSVRNDSGDDVENMSLGGSFDSLPPRQLSSNTSYSRSHSPASPYAPSLPRSPSVSSECSYNSQRLPKPAFNFSRPRPSLDSRPSLSDLRPSLNHRPSFERARTPSRQASGDGSQRAPSRQEYGEGHQLPSYAYEQVHTPISMASDDYMSANGDGPAPSYIYAKYALPRGRTLDRESLCPQDFMNQQIKWENGAPSPSGVARRPPSPSSPPKSATSERYYDKPKSFDIPRPSSPSAVSSNSTLKPHHSRPSSSGAATSVTAGSRIADMTPSMHLEKGIEFHEKGQVQKATYHWRLAAKAEIPTAMLLYALACRHGWGMRPNPSEGVKWLRKAVDAAQLECADDEDLVTKGKPGPDVVERRTHKAQFAVSVYELGVSYMNGWGIQQDKGLALRCFEIAGNWGDGDALAEAGFCYHEGVGCKKDLKRSAKFYRMAEAKGVSVAGNSWIHKDKYKDDEVDDDRRGRSTRKEADKKARDKSRTRALFSRKKSLA